MAHRTEGVVTLVVGEEEDDVRAGRSFIGLGGGVGSMKRGQRCEEKGGEEW